MCIYIIFLHVFSYLYYKTFSFRKINNDIVYVVVADFWPQEGDQCAEFLREGFFFLVCAKL